MPGIEGSSGWQWDCHLAYWQGQSRASINSPVIINEAQNVWWFFCIGGQGKEKSSLENKSHWGGQNKLSRQQSPFPLPSQPQALEVAACGHKNDDGIVALSSCLLGGKSWLVCFGLVCLPWEEAIRRWAFGHFAAFYPADSSFGVYGVARSSRVLPCRAPFSLLRALTLDCDSIS